MSSRPKILITGGLGNLGSWLLGYFCSLDYDVHVLSKNRRTLVEGYKFHLILSDVSNIYEMNLKLKKADYDYVIHLASYNDQSAGNYEKEALMVNALGTRNLLEMLKESGVKHFIYLSTFQVYGKYQGHIDETLEPAPANDYGLTHLFAEEYVKMFGRKYNIPYTILRPTNGYGAPKDINSSKWNLILNDLSRSAFNKKRIELHTNGSARRDFIWLGSVCDSIHKLLEKGPSNTVFNISREKTFTTLEIAETVRAVYKEEFNEEVEIVLNKDDKTDYPDDLFVSSQKLRSYINIKDQDMLEQEIRKIFELLSKNG